MTSTAAGASSSAAKSESYLRADKIDLESLDIQLEKQLAKTWEKHKGSYNQGPREDWEIDLAKLEIRYVIAQGTYGTVYRGTYDGQDVAGTPVVPHPDFVCGLVVPLRLRGSAVVEDFLVFISR
jgi:hypothetical protein